jgi:exonuclease SbcC
MIPIRLAISGFLSYRDPVELDFTQFELACISGANGAGKSALLDAITFALFGRARNRGDALINSHRDVAAASVALTFGYESNVYRVHRTSPRNERQILEFQIQTGPDSWKALTERTLRETEARIYETLRLDYETFVNASFFLQGQADLFTQQNSADRKRILSSILGLEVWEEYRLRAAAERKKVEDEITSLQGRLQEINAELAEEDARKARLADLQTQLSGLSQVRAAQESALEELRRRAAAVEQQAALAATLQAQLERTRAQLADLQRRLEERRTEGAISADLQVRSKEIQKSYSAWLAMRDELTALDASAGQFHEQQRQRAIPLGQIETERARLETELTTLKREQENLQSVSATAATIEQELKALNAEIAKNEKQLAKRAKVESDLEDQLKAQTKANSENPILKEEMLILDSKIKQMEAAKADAACPTCGQHLTEEHRVSVITGLTKTGTTMGDRYRANRKALETATKKVEDLEFRLTELSQLQEDTTAKTVRASQLRSRLEEMLQTKAAWQEQRGVRLAEVEALLAEESFAAEARAVLAKIDAELTTTGYDPAHHDMLRRNELEARAIEAQMRALEQAEAAAKPLEREIADLEKQISSQIKEEAAQAKAYEQAAATLDPAGQPDVATAERTMLDTQERENLVRQALGAAQQEVAVLDTLRQRRNEYDTQRAKLAGQVSQFQSLERAFGKDGVPSMLIEQALPQIEIKANEILDRLSAGNMNMSFLTQQKYKDSKRGDMRETLEIQISDSAGVRDYEMFSGGEAFRINFAIRLALSEVLAQRAGARLQTLVIDEGFGSQDEAGRQRLVEAIGLVRRDFAKILVITHIDALKDAFPNRIEVEKGPRGSTVRVF